MTPEQRKTFLRVQQFQAIEQWRIDNPEKHAHNIAQEAILIAKWRKEAGFTDEVDPKPPAKPQLKAKGFSNPTKPAPAKPKLKPKDS
jgi:hypothetical protein